MHAIIANQSWVQQSLLTGFSQHAPVALWSRCWWTPGSLGEHSCEWVHHVSRTSSPSCYVLTVAVAVVVVVAEEFVLYCCCSLLFWFLVALFIVVEVVLSSFFAKTQALKGHYIILNQTCFDETASSCIVAMSLSQKTYCCHVVPNQWWGSWSKNSKLISDQAASVGVQYDLWCLLKSRKNYLNECRQHLNVFSSPNFSNHVWQMSQLSLVSLTAWHLPNVSACRTLPSPLIFVGAFPASGLPVGASGSGASNCSQQEGSCSEVHGIKAC